MSPRAVQAAHRPWLDSEIEKLRAAYARGPNAAHIRLPDLAVELGRNKPNVCRKARQLGLTNQSRPIVLIRSDAPKYKTQEERNRACSERVKKMWQERPHPRGALGMKHTPESLARMSVSIKRSWADPTSGHNSAETSQRRSDNLLARIKAGLMRGGWYSRAKGGKRADLGDLYLRSSWEANYARYLNFLIQQREITSWEYEPKTFVFETIKRGNRAYTPDFRVVFPCGRHEWHEVKGWMDHNSRLRLERMAKFYPEETLKVIGQPWFKQAVRGGLANVIVGWEKGSV